MTEARFEDDLDDIREDNTCLVTVMDDHFMTQILEVSEDTVRISFPATDYPIQGMPVELEFHDKLGFNRYPTRVIEGPTVTLGEILVERPRKCLRSQHRDSCRVPTDLTVQVKDEIHFRRYDAELLNLSGGGALLRTSAPFDFNTTIEIMASLPGEAAHTLLGTVIHLSESDKRRNFQPTRVIGVRFLALEPHVQQSITRYLWARLRELYEVP